MEFEALYRRYKRLVKGYFLQKRVPLDEAEELVQEVFLNAYRGRRRFRGDAHATTWLLVIARNLFANYVRGRKTAKRDAPEVSLEGLKDEGDAPIQVPADDPDALEGVLDEERREYLREAVRALPDRTRQIMRLVFVHGLKYREIADLLGISVNTVKSSVFQGKKKLKDILSDRAPDLDLDLGGDEDEG